MKNLMKNLRICRLLKQNLPVSGAQQNATSLKKFIGRSLLICLYILHEM